MAKRNNNPETKYITIDGVRIEISTTYNQSTGTRGRLWKANYKSIYALVENNPEVKALYYNTGSSNNEDSKYSISSAYDALLKIHYKMEKEINSKETGVSQNSGEELTKNLNNMYKYVDEAKLGGDLTKARETMKKEFEHSSNIRTADKGFWFEYATISLINLFQLISLSKYLKRQQKNDNAKIEFEKIVKNLNVSIIKDIVDGVDVKNRSSSTTALSKLGSNDNKNNPLFNGLIGRERVYSCYIVVDENNRDLDIHSKLIQGKPDIAIDNIIKKVLVDEDQLTEFKRYFSTTDYKNTINLSKIFSLMDEKDLYRGLSLKNYGNFAPSFGRSKIEDVMRGLFDWAGVTEDKEKALNTIFYYYKSRQKIKELISGNSNIHKDFHNLLFHVVRMQEIVGFSQKNSKKPTEALHAGYVVLYTQNTQKPFALFDVQSLFNKSFYYKVSAKDFSVKKTLTFRQPRLNENPDFYFWLRPNEEDEYVYETQGNSSIDLEKIFNIIVHNKTSQKKNSNIISNETDNYEYKANLGQLYYEMPEKK